MTDYQTRRVEAAAKILAHNDGLSLAEWNMEPDIREPFIELAKDVLAAAYAVLPDDALAVLVKCQNKLEDMWSKFTHEQKAYTGGVPYQFLMADLIDVLTKYRPQEKP